MTLQSALIAKTASDAAAIQPRAIISSLVMTDIIDTKITEESQRVDKDERTYSAKIELSADMNGGTSAIQIIQSDDSKVLLPDIENALLEAGYKVAIEGKRASRVGGQDRIILTVAWD